LGLPLFPINIREKGKRLIMKTIKVADTEVTLEYTFEAAEYKAVVQKMYLMLTGMALVKDAEDLDNPSPTEMIDGSINMFADIPETCKIAFYAGLLENNPMSNDDANLLMRSYMKENKLSYTEMFEQIKECMEEDGFFHLIGLDDALEKMSGDLTQEVQKTAPKKPADHKKAAQKKTEKSTSTK